MRLAGLILLSRLQMRVLLEFGPFCLLFFKLNAGLIGIRVLLEGESYLRIYGNYFRLHICLSFHLYIHLYERTSHIYFFQFLQLYHKMTLMKDAWHVLRVKNMQSGSPSDIVHYNIRRGEAKLHILKLTSVFHHLPRVGPKQLCDLAHLGCTHKVGNS